MTSTYSLFYDAITGESQETLKNEKKKTLLKQYDNIQEYKEKLGSYKASMAAAGAGSISSGVYKGYADEVKNKNEREKQNLNKKIISNKKEKRQKSLLFVGLKNALT
jgi:hypothetical protein